MVQWDELGYPKLPSGLRWGRDGLKVLGVFIGNANIRWKKWESMLDKVSA